MEARLHLHLTSPQTQTMLLKPTHNPSLFSSHLKLSFSTSRFHAAKTNKPPTQAEQLKLNWLASLSSPKNDTVSNPPWVSGALALLKPNAAHVYDSPHLKVVVGKTIRRRLDAKSLANLLTSLDAPIGSIAYVEQSCRGSSQR